MMRSLTVIFLILLTGCATTPQTLRRDQDGTLISSALPPGQAAACMARNMETANEGITGYVRDLVDRKGVELTVRLTPASMQTLAVAEVTPAQGGGSSAIVWTSSQTWLDIMKRPCRAAV